MRPTALAAAATLLLVGISSPRASRAQLVGSWIPNGVRIAGGPASTRDQLAGIEDGAGGALFAWRDDRDGAHNVYAMHLDGSGNPVAGWNPAGLRIAPSPNDESVPLIVPDGAGGAFVVWTDARESPTHAYAQHVLASGATDGGWPANGKSLVPGTVQASPRAVTDGSGGLMLAWDDGRTPSDPSMSGSECYAVRLRSSGDVAPGWPALGVQIGSLPSPNSTTQSSHNEYGIAPDRNGGVFIGYESIVQSYFCEISCRWQGSLLNTLYHLDANRGVTLLWQQAGLFSGLIQSDLAGNAWCVAGDQVQEILNRDSPVNLTLTSGGIFGGPYFGALSINPDPGLGALIIHDYTFAAESFDSLGNVRPGWAGWKAIANPNSVMGGGQGVSAANGGWIVLWVDNRLDADGDVYALGLNRNRAITSGWLAAGNPVCNAAGAQMLAAAFTDANGGAIVGWTDTRSGSSDVYAQRIAMQAPTAALTSLVSASAANGAARVVWQLSEALAPSALVQRSVSEGAWQDAGAPRMLDQDLVEFDDATVVAGRRYGYRLEFTSAGQQRVGPEAWIDVPASATFALRGALPNPTTGAPLTVAFSLPRSGDATLELLDLAGRRIVARDVGELGAGAHVEPLAAALPTGLYWLRLAQGGETRTARVVVAR